MINRVSFAAVLVLVLGAVPAVANAPERSLRPVERPVAETTDVVIEAAVYVAAIEAANAVRTSRLRPQLRPASEQVIIAASRVPNTPSLGPDTSARPFMRPSEVEEKAFFRRRKNLKGSVCGVAEIKGEPVGKVSSKVRGCGVSDAVKVTSVSGVTLSTGAVMTCETAQALNQWVERSVKPTFRRRGPIVEMKVAAHYVCRTRNHRSGAKISEHGKGKAIDISAFKMMDGEQITVAQGWSRGATRRLLQRVWKDACGPFGTVLGPNSDRWHRDHFHLDTARHRGGPYCR